jgi:hypothetical protein
MRSLKLAILAILSSLFLLGCLTGMAPRRQTNRSSGVQDSTIIIDHKFVGPTGKAILNSHGSGTVIGKRNGRYTVVTALHVVQDERFDMVVPESVRYLWTEETTISLNIRRSHPVPARVEWTGERQATDIAVISFDASKTRKIDPVRVRTGPKEEP